VAVGCRPETRGRGRLVGRSAAELAKIISGPKEKDVNEEGIHDFSGLFTFLAFGNPFGHALPCEGTLKLIFLFTTSG